MSGTLRFPSPFEVETPAGCEGWEEMYPYYLISRPETRDVERKLFWIADKIHNPYVCVPFDILPHEAWGVAISQYTNRTFVIPGARGIERRLINGYLYLGFVPVEDPQEIEQRVAQFQRRAGYYYQHWNDLYEQWKRELEGVIHEMEQLGFEPMPEFEPEEDVFARKLGRSFQLYHTYRLLVDRVFQLYQRHFEFLNIGYAAYLTFFSFCKQAFPEISDQTIARMVAGIDVILFRPDDELRKLATKAHQLGLSQRFLETPVDQLDQLLTALQDSPEGREWLAAFEAAKHPWFYYSSGSGLYHDHISWIDDLRLPLATIRDYIKQLQAGQAVERPLEQLREERERLAQEYRQLLATDEERQQFDQLLALSRTVFPFVEEHNFYVEHWSGTVFWRHMRTLGRILAEAGAIEQPGDLFYFNPYELERFLFDFTSAWATGIPVRGKQEWKDRIARRKEIIAVLREWTPVPCLGDAPETVSDPFAIMLWGVTTDRVQEWLRGETGAGTVLSGMPAAPGVIEGRARVVRDESELPTVEIGEILVCPITAPSWGPTLAKVKGVVTDIGGMMSHAAIICREYGVPAVVGTAYATSTIKTGQRIRVDGDRGVVEILE